jgi:hypothetical protein
MVRELKERAFPSIQDAAAVKITTKYFPSRKRALSTSLINIYAVNR